MNIVQITQPLQLMQHDAPPCIPGIIRRAPISIEEASASVIRRFDRNGDGVVDIAESRSTTNPNIAYFRKPLHDSSVERMVRGADLLTGNGDGVASKEEIAALMRKFDVGSGAASTGIMLGGGGTRFAPVVAGDGKLTGSELINFNMSFGETSRTRLPILRRPHHTWWHDENYGNGTAPRAPREDYGIAIPMDDQPPRSIALNQKLLSSR